MNFEAENSIKSRKDSEISTPKTCSKQKLIVEQLGDGFGRAWESFWEDFGRILGRCEGLFHCNFDMGVNNQVDHIFESSTTIMARRNARIIRRIR